MNIFGDTDFLGVWLRLLVSPFGLLLLGLVVGRIVLDRLLEPPRRGPTRRRRSRSARVPSTSRQPTAQADLYQEHGSPHMGVQAGAALEIIKQLSPGGFEEFVADLFHRRGYAVQVVGGDGDHGVDLVVTNPDGERELVQCKRWGRKWLGEPVVRDFYGALMHDGVAVRGYIVTTSFFSHAARTWAQDKPIKLIDGEELSWAAERIIALGRDADKALSGAATNGR
jgi:restriction system protein